MPPSFDLLTQPWLPCLPLSGGAPRTLSLIDALAEAHTHRELVSDSPLMGVALHRLLLAVLHRAYAGPQSKEEWHALRNAEHFDAKRIREYLTDARWRTHFDLFDPQRPFYQVPEMVDAQPVSVAKLSIERASGNNITLFDHTTSDTAAFLPAEAARYLVAFQLYALGGGVSHPFNLADAPLARDYSVLVRGETLFETLMLNMLRYVNEVSHMLGHPVADDAPWWERERDPEPDRAGTMPSGYCDYLTWQSRRVHLNYDETTGVITTCQVQQNLKLSPSATGTDPFKAYRKVKKGEKEEHISRRLSEGKAAWRDSHALLEEATNEGFRPEVFNWLADLFLGSPEDTRAFTFEVAGYLTDGPQGAVILWRRERLPLPIKFLTPEGKELRDELYQGLESAEKVSRLFGTGSVSAMASTSGKTVKTRSPLWVLATGLLTMSPERTPDPRDIDNLVKHFASDRTYWAALEPPFRRFMHDLAQDPTSGQSSDEHYSTVLHAWKEEVRAIARRTFESLMDALASDVQSLRATALAQRQFKWLLNEVLPVSKSELPPGGSTEQTEESA